LDAFDDCCSPLLTPLHFVFAHARCCEPGEVGTLELIDHSLHQIVVETFTTEPNSELRMRKAANWLA